MRSGSRRANIDADPVIRGRYNPAVQGGSIVAMRRIRENNAPGGATQCDVTRRGFRVRGMEKSAVTHYHRDGGEQTLAGNNKRELEWLRGPFP